MKGGGGGEGCLAVVSCHAGARVKFYINHAISRQEKKEEEQEEEEERRVTLDSGSRPHALSLNPC